LFDRRMQKREFGKRKKSNENGGKIKAINLSGVSGAENAIVLWDQPSPNGRNSKKKPGCKKTKRRRSLGGLTCLYTRAELLVEGTSEGEKREKVKGLEGGVRKKSENAG